MVLQAPVGVLPVSFHELDAWQISNGRATVTKSIIEAIQMGLWDYEPEEMETNQFDSTNALPGSDEKLDVLAQRVQSGQPLWHPSDRLTYED